VFLQAGNPLGKELPETQEKAVFFVQKVSRFFCMAFAFW
jgi:hypothetical protein